MIHIQGIPVVAARLQAAKSANRTNASVLVTVLNRLLVGLHLLFANRANAVRHLASHGHS
jgi:hypothetical protein